MDVNAWIVEFPLRRIRTVRHWIPAFAGMTVKSDATTLPGNMAWPLRPMPPASQPSSALFNPAALPTPG